MSPKDTRPDSRRHSTLVSYRPVANGLLSGMNIRVWFSFLLLLWAESVLATDNYSYQTHEYATISGGRSPDGQWSIAAHGEGEAGYGDFDLYLMREPAHEKRAALRTRDCLDTAPLSLIAIWAPDSRHVVLLNRNDRHVLDMRLFAIADGKAKPIKVPLLLDVIGQPHLKHGVHYEFFSRLYRVTWQQADRFILEEFDTLDAAQPVFTRGIEPYITLERLGSERSFTDFSAQATGEIDAKGRLRFVGIKGLPESNWPKTILYSPHLLFDRERGLHSTETTVSSLGAQKSSQ